MSKFGSFEVSTLWILVLWNIELAHRKIEAHKYSTSPHSEQKPPKRALSPHSVQRAPLDLAKHQKTFCPEDLSYGFLTVGVTRDVSLVFPRFLGSVARGARARVRRARAPTLVPRSAF